MTGCLGSSQDVLETSLLGDGDFLGKKGACLQGSGGRGSLGHRANQGSSGRPLCPVPPMLPGGPVVGNVFWDIFALGKF